jgi:PKD repeat protein
LLQIFAFVFVTGTASAQLKADFSVTPVTGCPPMVVSFKDSSKGNPVYWKWDLGNGTTSFLQDPIGTYFNPGTYSVKLVIKNAAGSIDSIIKNKIIVVNAPPLASFSAADTMGCYPLKVKFKDSSIAGSGTITSWQWDFGDGTLSSQQNPAHTYKAAGLFNVTLRVVNSNGCTHVLYKPAYIKTQDGVKADFNFSVQKNCSTPTTVNFTNLSAGTGILTYSWNFGDGNSSNKQNPANVYTDTGNYSVRLIATTTFGCSDTATKANAITISSVTADFTTPSLICAGSAFVITNTSKPSTTSSRWQFGDGTISTDINPTKTYAAAGTYQVKLVNESGSCKDSVVKSLNVFARPVASFTATNTNGCTAPLTVNFTNTSTAASSVKWDFGDGTTSTANSPTHTYTSKGNFTVTLTATNTSGCSDIIVKSELVKIAPPGISRIKGLPVKGCLPYTIHPEAVIESNQTISSYRWDFGDGTTSTGILPSHTYTVAGIYDVKLIVTTTAGCKDSIVMKESVMVGKKLKTEFLADPLERCAMMPVQFTDLTKGDVHEWLWMFGDGKESTEQHPKHIYTDTGKMNVTLIVANYGCMDTLKKEKYVYIRPPVAGFDTAFKCNDPLTRNFKDISVLDKALGGISWSWDFGDNTTSSIQNPSHTYSAPGTYKVKLKVTNGNCWSERTKEVLVIKDNGRLTANDSARCLNTRITYNIANNNPANNKSYAWYFEGISGEAIVTTDLPVSVSFNSSGTRSSAVVTTNILNCRDTLYAAVPVKIFGTKAAFRANPPETCYGNTVTFIDTSITDGQHPIIEWRWDFGDGSSQTYTSGPFTHSYADVGSYNIKMVVKDSYGCRDSIYKSAAINITKSLARFIPSDTLICPNSSVTFTNSSEGVGLKYQWNFGDGTTSADESPVHRFKTEGTFKVRLVTVDKNGCTDSAFSTIAVYAAVANFEMSDSTSTCPPLLVDFTNTSTHFVKYTWDFGDAGTSELRDPSHMYTYAGTFFVKLTVMNNGGCTDSATRKVSIKGPSGVFNYNPLEACTPAKTDFAAVAKNTVKYIWDFNDGATIFTQVPASSHSFVVPGFYIPRLILEDSSGCRVAIPGKDTIKVFDVETHISASTRVV